MIREHAEAVLALLASGAHTLYDGQVPDEPSYPYWVLYFDPGSELATRLCATSNRADLRFQLISVGLTAEAAQIVADDGRSLVLDRVLSVAGRVCTPIRRESALPIRPDRDVIDPSTNRHPLYSVDTYHFVSYAT